MAAQNSPTLHTNRGADKWAVFLTGAAAVNLRTQSGKPEFGPQKSLIIGGAGAGTAVLVDEDGVSVTLPVQIGQTIPIDRALITITSLTSCSLLCYWYLRAIKADDPNYLFTTLNP